MNPNSSIATHGISQEVSSTGNAQPPLARREPVEHLLHGDRRIDDYAWLREKQNPEVIAYLNAENTYTDAVMQGTEGFQENLYREMLGRILQTDLSVPYRLRGYLYFTRTEEGKQYPIHCRRRDVESSPEELLLDLNSLAEGHSFLGLGSFAVSDDNQLLAYSLDTTGFRQFALHIQDLRTGETLPKVVERVTSVAWAADDRTLFYTVEDQTTKRSYRLHRHTLGSAEPDTLLYEESDERFRVEVDRTRSGAFLLLTVASHTTSEVRFLAADQPQAEFQPGRLSRRHPRILPRAPSQSRRLPPRRCVLCAHQFRRTHLPADDRGNRRPSEKILARVHPQPPGRDAGCRRGFPVAPGPLRA